MSDHFVPGGTTIAPGGLKGCYICLKRNRQIIERITGGINENNSCCVNANKVHLISHFWFFDLIIFLHSSTLRQIFAPLLCSGDVWIHLPPCFLRFYCPLCLSTAFRKGWYNLRSLCIWNWTHLNPAILQKAFIPSLIVFHSRWSLSSVHNILFFNSHLFLIYSHMQTFSN